MAGAAGVFALASCVSPNPTLFTLAPIPGVPQGARVRTVELRQIGLAGYLDRAQVVRSAAGFEVKLGENERWGEPLGGMIERVFTEDLLQRLPDVAVYSDTGAISARADRVVEVDVQRLDQDASGQVVLLAQLAVRPDDGNGDGTAETVRLSTTPASSTTRDLVVAESMLIGQLADRAAARISSGR